MLSVAAHFNQWPTVTGHSQAEQIERGTGKKDTKSWQRLPFKAFPFMVDLSLVLEKSLCRRITKEKSQMTEKTTYNLQTIFTFFPLIHSTLHTPPNRKSLV